MASLDQLQCPGHTICPNGKAAKAKGGVYCSNGNEKNSHFARRDERIVTVRGHDEKLGTGRWIPSIDEPEDTAAFEAKTGQASPKTRGAGAARAAMQRRERSRTTAQRSIAEIVYRAHGQHRFLDARSRGPAWFPLSWSRSHPLSACQPASLCTCIEKTGLRILMVHGDVHSRRRGGTERRKHTTGRHARTQRPVCQLELKALQ